MNAEPVTREMFAALVTDLRGELAGVTEQRRTELFAVPRRAVPAAWRGRPWARTYADVETVMILTALTRNSVICYDGQARRARAKGELTFTYNYGGAPRLRRLMPQSVKTGRHRQWMIGELALWIAAREDRQATATSSTGRLRVPRDELITQVQAIYERDGQVTASSITKELGLSPQGRVAAQLIHDAGLTSAAHQSHSATDEQILEAARAAVAARGGRATAAHGAAILLKAGVGAESRRFTPFLTRVRLERIQAALKPTTDDKGAELESLRSDGLVTGVQVARAYGTSPGAVTKAREEGNIKAAGWEPYRGARRPLYDPARLWVRADGKRGPVDKDSPHAADISLD